MLMRNWLPALCAAVLVLSTGCGKECVDAFDCRNEKGVPPEGQLYACVENKCELRGVEPQPTEDAGTDAGTDAGVLTCTPECAATQQCDTSSGTTAVCVACITDAHCASVDATKPICLADKSACVQCRTNAECGVGQVCNASNTCEAAPAPAAADTSAQIATFLSQPEGAIDPPQAIAGAYVTYLKPAVGDDLAGFFLQAEPQGPAMFVSVDPATLSPALKVGDRVNLTVGRATLLSKSAAATSGVKAASDLGGVTVLSSNHPVQNLNTATPPGLGVDQNQTSTLVSNVNEYVGELLYLQGTIANGSASTASGLGHLAYSFTTPSITTGSLPKLRLPTALAEQLSLVDSCTFTLDVGPLWMFVGSTTTVQPSAYSREDFSSVTCPAPKPVSAFATSLTQVRVMFDRPIAPASITNAGAQFTFTGGITAQSATVSGRDVVVTTSEQTAGTEYSVSVAGTVQDTLGGAVVTPNTTSFRGYRPTAALLISEVQPNAPSSADLVELRVLTSGTTNGVVLQQDVNSPVVLATLPDVDVAQGDIIVVHMTPPSTMVASESTSKDQFPTSSVPTNYDTAWDFRGNNAGITFSSRVLLVKDASGTLMDAVPFARTTSPPPAAFPGNLQAIQAAGHWLPADCGGAPCTTTSTPTAQAVSADWTAVPTSNVTPSSDTVRRVSATDTHTAADWAVGAQSFGLANP